MKIRKHHYINRTFFISFLLSAVPTITDFLQAREANICRNLEGRHITPWNSDIPQIIIWWLYNTVNTRKVGFAKDVSSSESAWLRRFIWSEIMHSSILKSNFRLNRVKFLDLIEWEETAVQAVVSSIVWVFRRLKKAKFRKMSGYALYSVCPQLSFFLLNPTTKIVRNDFNGLVAYAGRDCTMNTNYQDYGTRIIKIIAPLL